MRHIFSVILIISLIIPLSSTADPSDPTPNILPDLKTYKPPTAPTKPQFSLGNCNNLLEGLNRCTPTTCTSKLILGEYKYQIIQRIEGYRDNMCHFERTYKTHSERNQPFSFTISCKLDNDNRILLYNEIMEMVAGQYASLLSLDNTKIRHSCRVNN